MKDRDFLGIAPPGFVYYRRKVVISSVGPFPDYFKERTQFIVMKEKRGIFSNR